MKRKRKRNPIDPTAVKMLDQKGRPVTVNLVEAIAGLEGPKYPHVQVFIPPYDTGTGGPSGMMILANVAGALKKANVPPEEVAAFYRGAGISKNYNALLSTIKRWVTVT